MSTVTLPVSKAKECFAKLVKNSEELFDRYVITRNGKEAAVVMSAEEYASLLETIDIVSNRKEVKAIAHGIAQARSKKTIHLISTSIADSSRRSGENISKSARTIDANQIMVGSGRRQANYLICRWVDTSAQY
ncbi:MAG: type II toxin-antitoxin system Phd/YefM family antitoxin [Ignavibacteria bacterium]|nr:type II toxin-antitoxin system Phd/YefM family antitoxin [Ignavibacteria bacterium]